MNIAVPSRFACLKIEDDDFRPASHSSKQKSANKSNKKANDAAKNSAVNGSKKKQSNNADVGKPKSSSKKPKKPKEEHEKNWEEWQKKDDKFVNDVFEEEMQNAMLQSKLEFEQQKSIVVVQIDREQNKKKKRKTTMSLDQFLDKNKEPNNKEEAAAPKQPEKDFFVEMLEQNQKVITKERVEQDRKQREKVFNEVVSLAHCQEQLEAERAKNQVLEKELKEARNEIALVKLRNTSLCSMLGQGEMKDKAQVLAELRKLTMVKEELTEEVAHLHALLEQERSNKNPQSYSGQTENNTKHGKEKIKKKKH
ncbi:G kinase-anchoring protein 1 [Dendroctonus ponderosae]